MCCNVQMAVTALVACLNPAIVARQNSGIDSEEVRARLVKRQSSVHIGKFCTADIRQSDVLWN